MFKFIKYYFSQLFNDIWTFTCLLFIILLSSSASIYHSIIFYVLSLIPFLLLAFNVVTEYNTFKNNGVSSKIMTWLFFGACFLIIIIAIIMLL